MADENVIFIGARTITAPLRMREKNDVIQVGERNPWLPFLTRWRTIMGNAHPIHTKNFQMRSLISPDEGVMEENVKLFFFDIDTMEPYMAKMNPNMMREYESLQVKHDYLYQMVQELTQMIENSARKDEVKEFMKREMDFYTGLKPAFAPSPDPKKGGKK